MKSHKQQIIDKMLCRLCIRYRAEVQKNYEHCPFCMRMRRAAKDGNMLKVPNWIGRRYLDSHS